MTMVKMRLPPDGRGASRHPRPFPQFSGGQSSAPAVARFSLDISSERRSLGRSFGMTLTALNSSTDLQQSS
jgi:hypothetical protein